ncbi:MAG: hypothetical protein ABJH05_03305 [Fulvivirga sp.]
MKKYLKILIPFLFLATFSIAQEKAVHYETLQKHLPSAVNGFSVQGEPEGSNLDMNGMSYSMASKKYSKGDSKLNIAIVDYKGAAAMFQTSTMAWANSMAYEDAHQKAKSITIDGMNGWFSYNKDNKEIQLLIASKERYLVTISISNATDEDLAESILKKLNIGSLPN